MSSSVAASGLSRRNVSSHPSHDSPILENPLQTPTPSAESESTTKPKFDLQKFLRYFLMYSLLFWTIFLIYKYNTDQTFKQSFVRWYLKTFHRGRLTIPDKHVDFKTYGSKLPFKKSGGTSEHDFFVFTKEDLSHYDGTDASLPILIAIKGRVYDVSEGKDYYGPKGGYHFFAGRDGTRTFTTGCFDDQKVECTSRSHDYSDLDESQMESINDWVKFYDEHEKYRFVGKVEV